MKALQFRLVDALVLVAILSLVVGVLLPGLVKTSKDAGRRTTCLSNMKQISLGPLLFEQRHGHFPGYVNPQAETGIDSLRQATRPVGWAFSILPYLERNDIAQVYGSAALERPDPFGTQFGSPFDAASAIVKVFICPSDPWAERTTNAGLPVMPAPLSYVVNCGLKDLDPPSIFVLDGRASPRDRAANGVFHFNYPFRWATDGAPYPAMRTPFSFDMLTDEPVVRVSANYIAQNDGLACTLMLSENVDSGDWNDPLEHQVGIVWQAASRTGQPVPSEGDWLLHPLRRINDDSGGIDSVKGSAWEASYARPSSYHPGVVNVAWADGHVEVLADSISYEVYCKMMTPCDAEAGLKSPVAVDAPGDRK